MKPFVRDEDLSRLLVLTPYRPSISDQTTALLDMLTHFGAGALKLPNNPDIAYARNLLSAAACEFIGHSKQDIDVVMWLDADITAHRDTVFRQLNHLQELEEDIVGLAALSGMYCRRREANVLEASRIENRPLLRTSDGTLLLPAHTGLGCFMQSAATFLRNCESAEQLWNERGERFPAVCKTGPRMAERNGETVPTWGPEHWWYCERLWSTDVPVYLDTSCAWGHLCESLTAPSGIPEGMLLQSEIDQLSESDAEPPTKVEAPSARQQ